jgi:serine/threonine protein kinase
MSFSPGENVGPYRIVEQLGSGGMATVFKAYHATLDRYVAIKVLHPAFKGDPQFFERFKREARIVANLEHPNIIPVYDFNEHNGQPYLVMRFIEGDTLKPNLEGKPMPPAEILRLMRPICQALAYAHKQGVLHRDIKPSNIMETREGNIFITDFGLARMVQTGTSSLTQDMMVGTPQYISPEQARGVGELDGRTDIYSLGVVLFEMFTGRVPFKADTPFATIHDHIYTPLPLPTSINPEIEPAIERLLLKALAKEPKARFATADELLQALETTLASQAAPVVTETLASPRPASTLTPRKKSGWPWWVWAGALAIILLCGLGLSGLLVRAYRNRSEAAPNGPPPTQQGPGGDQAPGGNPALPHPTSSSDTPNPSSPLGAAMLTRRADRAREQDQFEEAIELYKQAIVADPRWMPAYFGLAEALGRSGREADIPAVFEQAVANNPEHYQALLQLGQAQLLIAEDPEAALQTFEKAASQAPQAGLPLAGQALALLALDRVEAAKEALDAAKTLDGVTPEIQLATAVYLFKQGQTKAAIREIERLLQDQQASVRLRERARQLLNQITQ